MDTPDFYLLHDLRDGSDRYTERCHSIILFFVRKANYTQGISLYAIRLYAFLNFLRLTLSAPEKLTQPAEDPCYVNTSGMMEFYVAAFSATLDDDRLEEIATWPINYKFFLLS